MNKPKNAQGVGNFIKLRIYYKSYFFLFKKFCTSFFPLSSFLGIQCRYFRACHLSICPFTLAISVPSSDGCSVIFTALYMVFHSIAKPFPPFFSPRVLLFCSSSWRTQAIQNTPLRVAYFGLWCMVCFREPFALHASGGAPCRHMIGSGICMRWHNLL